MMSYIIISKDTLESHYKEMQDIEFTIENQKLWILQTRKRQTEWSSRN